MTKGDIDVLRRIEKQDKRADRASRLLIKKLSRKRRSPPSYCMVESPKLHAMSFASATNFVAHEDTAMAQRRLVKARDDDGKRAFYVGEIGCENDEPMALLIVPKSKGASQSLACQRVLKQVPLSVKVSSQSVCVLQCCNNNELSLGGTQTSQVLLQKLHMDNGLSVFYALPFTKTSTSAPWSLGLDKSTYTEIQVKLARLLGAKLC